MEKRRFLDFLDMVDGGGAGAMGDKFEGGGAYSAIGNLLGSPYGSEDPERKAARQAVYSSANIGGGPAPTPAPATNVAGQPMGAPTGQSPLEMFGGQQPAAYTPPAQSPLEMFGGQQPAAYTPPPPQYGGRGSMGMPYPEWAQDQQTRDVIDYLRSSGVQGY